MQQVMTDICVTIQFNHQCYMEYFRGNPSYFWRMYLGLNYINMTKNTNIHPQLNGYGDNGKLKF